MFSAILMPDHPYKHDNYQNTKLELLDDINGQAKEEQNA